ncbi:MAG: UDP-N-acetylmuramate--L-alanine ligase [Actinomycetota bacterium]
MTKPYVPPEGSVPTQSVPTLAGVRALHLIGIGGSGMRNMARLYAARGIVVSGSDLKESAAVRDLRAAGATIAIGHDAGNVPDVDAVVVSAAVSPRNPEVRAAADRGIPLWSRAQGIAAAAADRRTLAVTGTHGKTTTTSMLALILERAGADPSYVIGGEPNETGGGARAGASDLFVVEADESDGTFLLLTPAIGVVTNVEVDHVDFYRGGREEIESAFAAFAARCGRLVACADDPGVVRSLEGCDRPVTTYGVSADADVRVEVLGLGPTGAVGRLTIDGRAHDLRIGVDGAHNLLNAAAAVATAALVGVDPATAAAALASFTGVHRRFEHRGSVRGADFFDDYGHVPTELAVTLGTASRRGARRVIAVFQPHRYSRTQALWRELGESLVDADLVVVTDVYGADQEPIPGVTGKLVVRGIAEASSGRRIVYLPHRADVVRFLDREVRSGDLVLTMGCGDVWMLGDAALAAMREVS